MVRKIIGVVGFIVGGVAALVLALGFVGPFSHDLDAFAHLRPQMSLLLLVAAILLMIGGKRGAAAASAGVGVLGLALMAPVWRALPALADSCVQERVVVATANVHFQNPRARDVMSALLRTKADIIAVQELSDSFWAEAGPLLAAYRYRALEKAPSDRPRGAGLFSKRPLRVVEAVWGKEPVLQRAIATVRLAGREIAVASFHFDRPLIEPQKRQLSDFSTYVAALPTDRILMGDFNATPWSHAVSEIERTGGVKIVPGLRRTWKRAYPNPIIGPDIPAIIGNQIDHIFLSEGLGVKRVRTFKLPGSPHWGVKAIVELPPTQGCAPPAADGDASA